MTQYSSVKPKTLCQSQFFNEPPRTPSLREASANAERLVREGRKEKKEMLNPSVLNYDLLKRSRAGIVTSTAWRK
jgi:hypothetical protein